MTMIHYLVAGIIGIVVLVWGIILFRKAITDTMREREAKKQTKQ